MALHSVYNILFCLWLSNYLIKCSLQVAVSCIVSTPNFFQLCINALLKKNKNPNYIFTADDNMFISSLTLGDQTPARDGHLHKLHIRPTKRNLIIRKRKPHISVKKLTFTAAYIFRFTNPIVFAKICHYLNTDPTF